MKCVSDTFLAYLFSRHKNFKLKKEMEKAQSLLDTQDRLTYPDVYISILISLKYCTQLHLL